MGAYVTGFEHDLFISYAHRDETDGWVTALHERLKARFGELLADRAADIGIWRDPRLDPTFVLTPKIVEELNKTAVLLSIITPSSIASKWCASERRRFALHAQLTGGLVVGASTRVVNVVKTPMKDNAHRALIDGLSLEFCAVNPQSNLIEELQPNQPEFKSKVNALAQALINLFDRLNTDLDSRRREAVFVALPAPDVKTERTKIVQELEASNYVVFPTEEFVQAGLEGSGDRIKECLDVSRLAVHFAGDSPGMGPEKEKLRLTTLQFTLAGEYKIPRIVWVKQGVEVSDEFRTALDENQRTGTEILNNERQVLSHLKHLIFQKLGDPVAKPSDKVNVYLLCDALDFPADLPSPSVSREVYNFLNQLGLVVWLPPQDSEDDEALSKEHKETLNISDAVLVMWGKTTEIWARQRQRELIAIQTERGHRPFRVRAVALAPPPSNQKQYLPILDMAIDLSEGFNPSKLEAFKQRLLEP